MQRRVVHAAPAIRLRSMRISWLGTATTPCCAFYPTSPACKAGGMILRGSIIHVNTTRGQHNARTTAHSFTDDVTVQNNKW